MIVKEHVPLAPFTTFHIGGLARYFIEATSVEEVRTALRFAREKELEVFVLGGGSNILIADEGFPGVVLHVQLQSMSSISQGDTEIVVGSAGVSLDAFVAWTVMQGWSGLECLSGVPGTLGGAVVANVGAYGQQVSDTFISAEVVDTHDKEYVVQTIQNDACAFSYHDSMFTHHQRYVVLSATFRLPHGLPAIPVYKDNRFDTAAFIAKHNRTPTLSDVRETILHIRDQKGVLATSYQGAGSYFHMPFVSPQKHEEIRIRAHTLDAEKEERLRPWSWEQADGTYKVAPGFLIEYTEFQKGYARGRVGISPKHTLTVINLADASAHEVASLAHDIQTAVADLFGLQLEREVEYVGVVA